MERETLNLTEYDLIPLIDEYWKERDDYYIHNEETDDYIQVENGEWNNFELVNFELDYYNLEDSYDITNYIIKRLCDGKYFKFYAKYSHQEWIIIPNQKISEVFPVEKTVTVYE